MKNFKAVAAVDSFKGSLTSIEAGEAVKRGLRILGMADHTPYDFYISNSIDMKTYEPQDTEAWDEAYQRYLEVC